MAPIDPEPTPVESKLIAALTKDRGVRRSDLLSKLGPDACRRLGVDGLSVEEARARIIWRIDDALVGLGDERLFIVGQAGFNTIDDQDLHGRAVTERWKVLEQRRVTGWSARHMTRLFQERVARPVLRTLLESRESVPSEEIERILHRERSYRLAPIVGPLPAEVDSRQVLLREAVRWRYGVPPPTSTGLFLQVDVWIFEQGGNMLMAGTPRQGRWIYAFSRPDEQELFQRTRQLDDYARVSLPGAELARRVRELADVGILLDPGGDKENVLPLWPPDIQRLCPPEP